MHFLPQFGKIFFLYPALIQQTWKGGFSFLDEASSDAYKTKLHYLSGNFLFSYLAKKEIVGQ